MAAIGDVTPEEEHFITILRMSQLYLHCEDADGIHYELGHKALVKTIKRMNEEAHDKILLSSLPIIRVTSADRSKILAKGIYQYCEDETLSLANPGAIYNALRVSKKTRVVGTQERADIFYALLCFYDLSEAKPKNSGALMDAWKHACKIQDQWRGIFWQPFEDATREPQPEI